jgi:hypothetical protein
MELVGELQLLDGACVHRGFEDLVSIPSSPLRVEHRRIRVPEEVIGRGRRVPAAERDPDASADRHLVALAEERLVQDREDALGHGDRIVHRDVLLEEDDELVAAQPPCRSPGSRSGAAWRP